MLWLKSTFQLAWCAQNVRSVIAFLQQGWELSGGGGSKVVGQNYKLQGKH